MVYSLSEIDAQTKKAVRGAGFVWGHAEEAGKSARFLASHQLPGAALIAACLQERDARGQCPILMAAYLMDNADKLFAERAKLILYKVRWPLLLLPALAFWGRGRGLTIRLRWPGVILDCRESALQLNQGKQDTKQEALACAYVDELEIEVTAAELAAAQPPGGRGQELEPAVWEALSTFAKRTYVPATEASRRGAGPAD